MSDTHFHTLRIGQVQAEGDDALVLTFELPEALRDSYRFEAGQYLTLRHGDERRSYSICSAPGEPLRVGVRKVPGGLFSTWLHDNARVGMALDVMPPQGRFGVAISRQPRHVLAIAGGSGITPILSIIQTVLAADDDSRVALFYGNRRAATTMFKEALEDLKDRYLTRLALHFVFSREVMDTPIHTGRLDAEKISQLLRLGSQVDEAFICGPHALNDEAEQALLKAGLAPRQIHVERFGLPPDAAAQQLLPTQASEMGMTTVTIIRDGLSRVVPLHAQDSSILAAAVRAGLDLPFSCKSGVCATCRARVLQGQLRMDRNFALDGEEVAAGFVLTCQAHPTSDGVVISFDER